MREKINKWNGLSNQQTYINNLKFLNFWKLILYAKNRPPQYIFNFIVKKLVLVKKNHLVATENT